MQGAGIAYMNFKTSGSLIRRLVSWCLLIVAAVWLAGCGAEVTRPLEDPALRTTTPQGSVSLYDEADNPAATIADVKPGKRLDILALSGGGAEGVFGAGVLKGWTESGKRPQFDIVTGISTGALLSVFAFLGPQYDEALHALYTGVDAKDIFRPKSVLEGVTSDSLTDNTPLRRKVEAVVTPAFLDKIAREYRKGRRLYIGTTNLDAGKLVVWDVGRIAASGHPKRVKIVQDILMASAAVPGFFKPVYIQPLETSKAKQMHVDGSVKAPFLLLPFMLRPKAPQGKAVYIIVNGQLKLLDAGAAVKPKTTHIAAKTVTELMREQMKRTLYQAYVLSRKTGARFNLLYIPDDAPGDTNALNFDRARMRKLYEIGRRLGREGRWVHAPPHLAREERF